MLVPPRGVAGLFGDRALENVNAERGRENENNLFTFLQGGKKIVHTLNYVNHLFEIFGQEITIHSTTEAP